MYVESDRICEFCTFFVVNLMLNIFRNWLMESIEAVPTMSIL